MPDKKICLESRTLDDDESFVCTMHPSVPALTELMLEHTHYAYLCQYCVDKVLEVVEEITKRKLQ